MAVAAGDVRLASADQNVGVTAAGQRVRRHARPDLLARPERVDRDLTLVVTPVREHDAVLEELQRLGGHRVGSAGRGHEDVRLRQRVLEPRHAVPVHVRLERRDRLDLDDSHAAALAAGVAGEALADPAVADDAELTAGEVEIREPVDRRQRRLPGAVAVVEQVLAARVVREDRGKRKPSRRVQRTQPRDAGGRLLGDAGQPLGELGPVLHDSPRELGAVVDDELRLCVGDREQVGVELLARGAGAGVNFDAARHERRADRVLRRARVGARGHDLRARVREQRGQVRRLRLQVDDDRHPPPAQGSVREPLACKPVENGRVAGDPLDALLAGRRKRRIGDAGAGGGVHVERLPPAGSRSSPGLDLAAGAGVGPHLERRRRDE